MKSLWPVLLVACFWTAPVSAAEEFWGVQLPDFGPNTSITGLHRGPSGSVVIKFIAGPRGAEFVDYYDTALKTRLAPDKARQVATDNAVQRQVENALRLSTIAFTGFELTNAAGTYFGNKDLSGGRCNWPHDGALTIRSGDEHDYFFVWKLARPLTKNYGCGYRDYSVRRSIRTRYGSDSPSLYWSSGSDVYAVFGERYLVRFDRFGKTRFFEGRTDVHMVRSNDIVTLMEPFTGWADSGLPSSRRVQAGVDRIEAIMDRAIKTK